MRRFEGGGGEIGWDGGGGNIEKGLNGCYIVRGEGRCRGKSCCRSAWPLCRGGILLS